MSEKKQFTKEEKDAFIERVKEAVYNDDLHCAVFLITSQKDGLGKGEDFIKGIGTKDVFCLVDHLQKTYLPCTLNSNQLN